MKYKPRILVLTLSFGAGHLSAAQSIIGEFQKQMPDADLRLVDALADCRFLFRVFYVWTYWAMIRYAPHLWERFFNSRIENRDEQTAPGWMWRKGCRKVFDEIREFQPDLIVAAEVGACEIAVIARRDNLTAAEILNVITDFEAEPIWVKPEISAFAVATEQVKKQLQSWGAKKEKVIICGIPINESFAKKYEANETKLRFGLDARPVVLLMGGGMGPTRMDEVAKMLLQLGENLQIVALPGKDKTAEMKLKKLSNSATVTINVFSWTSLIAPLMQTAQILATKPGGVTLSEAAACGLPLVLFDAIPGPENANAAHFVEAGAAFLTKDSKDTAAKIIRLLQDGDKLRQMSESCRQLTRPQASRKIVELARQKINLTNNKDKILISPKKLSVSRRALAAWRKLKRQENLRSFFVLHSKRKKSAEKVELLLPEVEI
ncbi:MAG: glycosyltransferase [Actinomycetota bacterium]